MKNKLIFILVFMSHNAFSQSPDTVLIKYDEQFLYRYGSSFMKGGNRLSYNDLRNEFNNSSLSFDLYKKSKNNRIISTVLRLVSSFAIFGVVKGAQDNNTRLAYGFLTGQIVTALAGQYFNNKAITDLDRAIQIRNRKLLFPGR